MSTTTQSDIRLLEHIGDRVIVSLTYSLYQQTFGQESYIQSQEYLDDPVEYFSSATDLIADLRKHRISGK